MQCLRTSVFWIGDIVQDEQNTRNRIHSTRELQLFTFSEFTAYRRYMDFFPVGRLAYPDIKGRATRPYLFLYATSSYNISRPRC